ncbi:hypothetical protein ACFQZ4_51950 [Catellatospora coxensis]
MSIAEARASSSWAVNSIRSTVPRFSEIRRPVPASWATRFTRPASAGS